MTLIKALLIEWNPHTGKRAGDINPRDQKLRCNGWQNMGINPAIELRLVEDDRNLSVYENMDGVTLLIGANDINKAIVENFPPKLKIVDELIYTEHLKSKRSAIDIGALSDNREERLKALKEIHNIKGIEEIKPYQV